MPGLTPSQQAMLDLFQRHVKAELDGDIETTMATMTANPHLNHVPTMAAEWGGKGCAIFIRNI